MTRMALELSTIGKRKRIAQFLQAHPESVDSVLNYLKDRGHDLYGTDAVRAPGAATPRSPSGLRADAATPGTSPAQLSGSDDLAGAEPHVLDLPRCITYLEAAKVEVIKALCIGIEPSSMSECALRALIPPKCRQLKKESVVQLLEFATGMTPSTYLGTDGRLKSFRNLLGECSRRNEARGRRCRDIVLPVNWSRQGVFAVCQMNGVWQLGCMVLPTPAMVVLPPHVLKLFGTAPQFSIESNWSEQNANLRSPSSTESFLCARLFPDLVFGCEEGGAPAARAGKGAKRRLELLPSAASGPGAAAAGIGQPPALLDHRRSRGAQPALPLQPGSVSGNMLGDGPPALEPGHEPASPVADGFAGGLGDLTPEGSQCGEPAERDGGFSEPQDMDDDGTPKDEWGVAAQGEDREGADWSGAESPVPPLQPTALWQGPATPNELELVPPAPR